MNSQLEHIHLAGLFYVADLQNFGFDVILKPIVEDLKILETGGIDTAMGNLKGTIIALSFDNLGGNTLLGLAESFSATNYCRLCLANKHDAKVMTSENQLLNRSSTGIIGEFGVKNYCLLNELRYLNTFKSKTVDIMHDILEGVAQLEIKLFLKFIINELKLITLSELNERIASFVYGKIDMTNKPRPISLDKIGSLIGEKAAQTWCLVRYLPLILGDIVTERNSKFNLIKDKWTVITLLIHIIEIIFSPEITRGMIGQLKQLIEEHHTLFQSEFNRSLLPKHHLMIHYPTVIELMGPLVFLWCMRFEGKHNYFKNLAHKYRNFIHITKSLANQHQKFMFYNWNICEKDLGPVTLPGRGSFIEFGSLMNKYNLKASGIEKCREVLVVTSLKLNFLYETGFFITTNVTERSDLPVFKEIKTIFTHGNCAYAICSEWNTQYFHEQYRAFLISPQSEPAARYSIVNLNTLRHKPAYELHQSSDSTDWFIVPKYQILL